MASTGAIWGPATLRLLRVAVSKTATAVRTKVADATRPLQGQVQHIPLRSGHAGRHPIHPAALLKQQKRNTRWFSSGTAKHINNVVRRYLSSESAAAPRFGRSRLPSSNTSRRVGQSSGRAPFASALRPNLTGGAMPRTAGGYSLGGGGARYFSHTPTAPAQVVQNVSQAMRAFMLSGQKLRYDGLNARGERQYRTVSTLEDDAMRKLSDMSSSAPGAFIDFKLSPVVTAVSPLAAALADSADVHDFNAVPTTSDMNLNTEGFLDILSADFGRALKDLTATFADLRRLSVLGDLPISLEGNHTLRVRFPGADAETVNRLCDDIGIQRGVVSEDANLGLPAGDDSVALKFPFAPASFRTPTSPGYSAQSLQDCDLDDLSSMDGDDSFIHDAFVSPTGGSPWQLSSEVDELESASPPRSSGEHCSTEFEGLEGIYRFIEECDRGRGRVG